MHDASLPPAVLAGMVDAAGVAALYRDADGVWHASPGLQQLRGHHRNWATVSGAALSEMIHSDDIFDFLTRVGEATADGPMTALPVRVSHRTGEWRSFLARFRHAGGGGIAALEEVTAIRQVEAALLDSQMRLHGIYNAAPVAIIQWTREGRIAEMNPAAERMLGVAHGALLRQKLAPTLIHPEAHAAFAASIAQCVADNRTGELSCRTMRPDGSLLTCDWYSMPIRNPKGSLTGVLSVVIDATARAESIEAMRHARAMAEQLSQAKTVLLATLSHELRTPLNAILGLSELLIEVPMEAAEQQAHLDDISASGRRLLAIVNAVLAYASADALPTAEAIEAFVPCDVLAVLGEVHEARALRKGLRFEPELSGCGAVEVRADRRGIEQVVGALLDNAVKFSEHGCVSLRAHLDLAGPRLVCCVDDEGPGIPEAFLAHDLFQPFRQAESVRVRAHDGVGLGLALAKRLADRLGGTLCVGAGPHGGTRAVFTCPVGAGPAAGEGP